MADSPFGKAARVQILRRHLAEAGSLTSDTAWKFIYQELLWIDGSTGLAHLYESDKAQPGRPWYYRTLTFNRLLCEQFGNISLAELRLQIDRLFRACLERLVKEENHGKHQAADQITIAVQAEKTEAADETDYMPDADLVAEFGAILRSELNLAQTEAEQIAQQFVIRARFYFTVGRKRQNVLGEGFEDLLQLLLIKVSQVPAEAIRVRVSANNLPGFQGETERERIESPDIAIVRHGITELVASVKWSLRHDRQKQMSDELDCYADLLSQQKFPKYVLITNEYDPGRLVNTAGLNRRGYRINHIYHINSDILLTVLQDHDRVKDILLLISSGRLRSMTDFFNELEQEYAL